MEDEDLGNIQLEFFQQEILKLIFSALVRIGGLLLLLESAGEDVFH